MSIQIASAVPAQVFSHPTTPDPSRIKRIENVPGFIKPKGGLWTTPQGSEGWVEWCQNNDFTDWMGHRQHVLIPSADAAVAVIDSLADLKAILNEYPGEVSWIGGTCIDFVAMARAGWDGIWLTDEGQWATRMSKPGLYGWDLESVLWFRWAFEAEVIETTALVAR